MEREKRTKAIEMTTGSIWKNLFFLSCPLVFSQVLEVLFNMSDVAVVGRFSDYRALGAVGSTTLLVTLFTGFLIGMGCGVNVRMAHELGARRRESVIKTVHSAFVICLIVGLLVGAACFFFAEGLLGILHTKEELMDSAVLYLKIYALGMPGMALYNCGNGILSATGDTKRPLVYLSIAGIVNVILNLFFVIVCHMAAEGVAIASVIGQYLSALLIVIHLLRRTDDCGLHPSKLRLDPACGKAILVLGIPTGIQNAIFAIANLFVQSGVNSFDAVMVSGNAAAANADTLIFNIMAAFYTGCSSFIGELGRWQPGTDEKELSRRADLFLCGRCDLWRTSADFRTTVSVAVCDGACCNRCRNAACEDHGIFLYDQCVYGLQHRSLPRNRKEHCADGHRYFRLLRVPGDLGVYHFCMDSYDSGAVLSLLFLLGDYICGGGALFQAQLSAAGISELSPGTRTVKIRQLFCRQIRFWCCCAVLPE